MHPPPRLRGLADDHDELVRALEEELGGWQMSPARRRLVDRFADCGRRLEFECAIRAYQQSLDRVDPFGRHSGRVRREIEDTYQLRLPALPAASLALPGGDTD